MTRVEVTKTRSGGLRPPLFLLITFIVLLIAAFTAYYSTQTLWPSFLYYDSIDLVVDDRVELNVRLADTPRLRGKGLSGTRSLRDDEGMLFIYNPVQYDSTLYTVFWMKDMLMPIDIIWIANGRIVAVDASVQPEPGVSDEKLMLYSPPVPITSVLEVRAGWAEEYGVEVGDRVIVEQN